ncbi:MAG TPA: tyrosine-type recombinase/integrase [Polyangiaceae bacterium]|nr:tyrosine-type recombinase/integrase [Polyangiaceae bacterium]
MSRNLKGTISRPAPDKLFARITAKDANGRTVRPRIPLDPSMSDEDAREMALRMTEAAKGRVWEPPKKKLEPLSKLPTCDEYFEKLWIPSRMGKVKSIRSDLYRYRLHIKPVIGKKRVDEVTADDLRDLVQKLDEKVEDDSVTFGAKNAINCWAVASKMFSDLAHSKKRELRLLKKNPAEDVQPPDRPTEVERQWLFPVELQQLLACEDVPVERRLLYAAAVYFCCRPGEVLGLLWRQGVDIQHGMVRVYRAWDSDKQRFNEYTKTGRSRHFAIEPILVPALKRAAEGRTRDLVFETLDRPYDWLRADLMTAKVERHALHHQRKGSRALRFHDLRATGITYMAMRGDTDNAIRERAGHTDFATTLIYIRRGHLAAGASIGSPFAPLPESLTGIVQQSSKTSSGGDAAPINGPPIPQKLRKTAWENHEKNSNPSLSADTSEQFSLLQTAAFAALPTGCPKSSSPMASVSALGARCMYLSVMVSVLCPTSS